ncbi:MAG: transglycosylase SLT domain-containing protein [Patescibacteria group bacterium]
MKKSLEKSRQQPAPERVVLAHARAEWSGLQKEIFLGYFREIEDTLHRAKSICPKLSQDELKKALLDLARKNLAGNDKAFPNRVVFRAACENKRQEMAAEIYRPIREKYQRLSPEKFLALRKRLGMDRLLREMGLAKGEFIDNLDFLFQSVPKIAKNDPELNYDQLLRQSVKIAAQKGEIEELFLYQLAAGVLSRESHGDMFAVSNGYALGSMGLTSNLFDGGDFRFPPINPFNPRMAVLRGVEYLAILTKEFSKLGDPEKRPEYVLTAYNAGPGAVKKALTLAKKTGKDWESFLPREGKQYAEAAWWHMPAVGHGQPTNLVELAAEVRQAHPEAVPIKAAKITQQIPSIGHSPARVAPRKNVKHRILAKQRPIEKVENQPKKIVLAKTIYMHDAKILATGKSINPFKIPAGYEITLTGRQKNNSAEAKFDSRFLKKTVIGWVPAEVARV